MEYMKNRELKPNFIYKNMSPILFLIFLVLKLTKQIDWSWWWVTSPIWIILAIGVFVIVVVKIYELFKMLLKK
jgi:hypothetical protein